VARKKKELPLLEKVTITDVAAEGKAVAKVNELVIFVPYVVPGDVVDLQVKRKKNHYAEAVAVKFHEKSPLRTEPFCSHFGVCGGCKWQCLSYEEQLKYKQKQVFDNLTRIGKVELPEFRPILGSEKTRFYRNKLEFTFSNKRWLTEEEVKQDVKYDQMNAVGFHIPGAFDKVLAIDKCWLQDDISNQIRNAVRDYAYAHNFPFFDLRTQEGLLRNIMIRTSSTGELMVVLQCKVTDDEGRRKMEEILQFMADSFPQITSLMYVINNKCNDTIGDLDVEVFKGNDHIFEEMEGLRFKVGPKSFYQTNSEQAYNLYKVAREFAHFFLTFQIVRNEFMQRWVEQTYVDRQSVHGLEDFLEVGFLVRQQFVEGFLAAFHVLSQNHFTHSYNLFVVEEHVFRTAQTDTYGTESTGILCVARCVGIGTDFQTGIFVAEFHQFGKVTRQFSRLSRNFSGIYISVGSVDGDVVTFFQYDSVNFHRTGLVVHVDGSGS
jgi:23S rRNA (uracil-5-)-methyltransferase RumA